MKQIAEGATQPRTRSEAHCRGGKSATHLGWRVFHSCYLVDPASTHAFASKLNPPKTAKLCFEGYHVGEPASRQVQAGECKQAKDCSTESSFRCAPPQVLILILILGRTPMGLVLGNDVRNITHSRLFLNT